MSEDRWDRLTADLIAAGIDARLDATPYQEMRHGRPVHGVSKSVTVEHPAGLVIVHDIWSRRNMDTWLGWEVYRENRQSIVQGRPSRWTKKRSEVVTAVQAALTQGVPGGANSQG